MQGFFGQLIAAYHFDYPLLALETEKRPVELLNPLNKINNCVVRMVMSLVTDFIKMYKAL